MPLHNLPHHATTFVGRHQEIADLTALLNTSACRLLTLVGPGGVGKTRLAIQVAAQKTLPDGVYFIPLQPLTSPEYMAFAIADAVGFQFYAGGTPQEQILTYFQDKVLLLVLDNFEHLMESAELLSEILKAAPGVRMLITSRERLNLLEEWVFDVRELKYPAQEVETDIEAYDAVQLFLQHAQRVQTGFTLTPLQKPAVIRICRLVAGMPLGIELAAAWVRVLSCEAIADEIERSLDILESSARNVEDRHRTMRATFEPIWKRLPVEEGEVFKKLSVFRGGFTREAAEQVAGASLRTLSALVDKCLIRHEPNGRYQIHQLLRQYAEEELTQNAEEIQRTNDAHAAYYMQFLKRREPDLISARQRETAHEFEAELDNIRAAWQQAVDQANEVFLQKASYPYVIFCDMQGRYLEAIDATEKAIVRLQTLAPGRERDYTLAILQNLSGSNLIRLGRLEAAQVAYEKSILLYESVGRHPPPGLSTNSVASLGLVAATLGNYDAAVAYGKEALEHIEASDKLNRTFTLYVLAVATYSQTQFEASLAYARQAYEISDGLGDKYFGSYILVVMGNIAQALEAYDRAFDYYETSYHFKKDANELGGMAFALNCMARIAWLRQDYPEAKRLFQEAYDLYLVVHDPGGLATSLLGLGDTAQAETDYATARAYFYRALVIAIDIHWAQLMLTILTGVSDFLIKTDEAEQAAAYLAMVAQHPASEPPTRRRADQLLQRVKPSGEIIDLDTAAQRLCDYLKLPKAYSLTQNSRGIKQASIDALSEREIEILRLLAEGLTNEQIAEKLVLVVGTVKSHNHHIFSKLGVSNRVQAIARARELNLI
jgi:predicted ATPase/DNA-binding NarL/FixJ family response regulator